MARTKSRTKLQGPREWIGGITSMPAYATDEGGESYRPEMLLWLDAGEEICPVGSLLGKPGEMLGKACDSLRETIAKPMSGSPRAPTRLRVASTEMAEALRAGHPSIEIVCAPTPEIDDVVAAMDNVLDDELASEQSFLVPGTSPEAVASFFRAAAALYRAKPWDVVPPDSVVSVTVESHGVHEAALSVMGHLGESFGYLLFSSIADFNAYIEAAEAMHNGQKPATPSYLVLNFVPGAELDKAARKEVSSHHWELAGARAYPWAVGIDKDMIPRPLTAKELALLEAVTAGLAKLVGEAETVAAAFAGDEPCQRDIAVATHAGEVAVSLRAPHREAPADLYDDDVLSALCDLEEQGDIADDELRQPLEDELVRQLMESPEGSKVSGIEGHRMLMQFAANHLGASIATLQARDLPEVLFNIIPRKVSIEASEAGAIIEDCRALYRFLDGAYGLEQAEACLRVLDAGAEKKLTKALADPRNFGMAKSLFMSGKESGFDMQSKEGIEAWMRSIQGKPLPPSVRLPGDDFATGPSRGRDGQRKKQRKAARKARRKNR
jgi:hypothetical protein